RPADHVPPLHDRLGLQRGGRPFLWENVVPSDRLFDPRVDFLHLFRIGVLPRLTRRPDPRPGRDEGRTPQEHTDPASFDCHGHSFVNCSGTTRVFSAVERPRSAARPAPVSYT